MDLIQRTVNPAQKEPPNLSSRITKVNLVKGTHTTRGWEWVGDLLPLNNAEELCETCRNPQLAL